uniref:Adenylate kinase n=2 Tax=Meloidogyne TaxID=189290 RepID=A0A915NYE3_9BILA
MAAVLNKDLPIIFIVGSPGCGKTTQCNLIAKKYGYTHLSSCNLMAAEVSSGSPLVLQFSKTLKAGQVFEWDMELYLIEKAMLKAVEGGAKGFLIDGFPRDVDQGRRFEEKLSPSHLVIFFDVTEETLVKRLNYGKTSGREDDNKETIRNRFRTFYEAAKPVVEYYQGKGKLAKINAEETIDDIFAEVCRLLGKSEKKPGPSTSFTPAVIQITTEETNGLTNGQQPMQQVNEVPVKKNCDCCVVCRVPAVHNWLAFIGLILVIGFGIFSTWSSLTGRIDTVMGQLIGVVSQVYGRRLEEGLAPLMDAATQLTQPISCQIYACQPPQLRAASKQEEKKCSCFCCWPCCNIPKMPTNRSWINFVTLLVVVLIIFGYLSYSLSSKIDNMLSLLATLVSDIEDLKNEPNKLDSNRN